MTPYLPHPSQPTTPYLDAFAPLSPTLLDNPVAYLEADHDRQRRLCVLLGHWVERGRLAAADGPAVVDHLRHDLDLHRRDEEEGLFPLLRARCTEPALTAVLERHGRDLKLDDGIRLELAQSIAQDLATETRRLAAATRSLMLAFATRHARRVLVETSRILTSARACLNADDLLQLTGQMRARRLAA